MCCLCIPRPFKWILFILFTGILIVGGGYGGLAIYITHVAREEGSSWGSVAARMNYPSYGIYHFYTGLVFTSVVYLIPYLFCLVLRSLSQKLRTRKYKPVQTLEMGTK